MRKHPKFKRLNAGRFKKLKNSWRRPRGIDSKQRMKWKSAGAIPRIGWRSPRSNRGLHPSGFEEVLVHNEAELKQVVAGKQVARFSATLGARKKRGLIEVAKQLKIKVLNA